jgi:hypothetical protein
MNYLLPNDLLSFMFNMCNFREIYGVTYADYICNTVDVSSILEDLIYSSDSYEDALNILEYFDVEYTHNYLELVNSNMNNVSNYLNNESENVCLSVTN